MKLYYEKYWKGTLEKDDAIYADPPIWPEKETTRILNALSPNICGCGLDAGCGDGTFTKIILNNHSDIQLYGVDISETAIEKAKAPSLLWPQFSVGDVGSLPFKSNSFDFVILIEVIEHVFDIQTLLTELNRVLKINGKLFITTTDFNFIKKLIVSLFFFDRYFYPTNPHIRIFTKKTLQNILKKNGFEISDYSWNGSYFGIMPKGQIMVCKKKS